MAEDAVRNRQFEYKLNSNLVLEADREARRRAPGEATGEVESLWSKIGGINMGDRVGRARPPELEEKLKKSKEKRARLEAGEEKEAAAKKRSKRGEGGVFVAGKGASVLTETQELDSINYRPKTRESRAAYEEMLALVQGALGDQPQDVLRGAAEEILALLKDDSLRDLERHSETEKLIGKMKPERFNKLVNLGKRITDFRGAGAGAATAGAGTGVAEADDEGQLDEEMGVAVVFDDDEGAVEQSDEDEVRDSEDEDDDMEGVEAHEGRQLRGKEGAAEEDEADTAGLDVHEIDAHWLQRGLNRYYGDANVSAKLAEDVLGILSLGDEREVENRLVLLLEYDKFDFVKLLLQNRAKVLYCTRLKQAQSDTERAAIEAEMRADITGGGPAILEALLRTESASSWNQDRTADFEKKTRKEARLLNKGAEGAHVVVVDEGEAGVAKRPETGGGSGGGGGGLVKVDLEGMAFQEGGHLMANKRCELPAGAWRAQKKGYEEVHVPAVKSVVPEGERTVSISDLPEWAQPAFANMDSLNRIQSKMYEAALFSSENLLLCAPTGAGKTNVAMLTMLHEIGQHRREDGTFDLDAFKIVYVAPMKALVQEVVAGFGERLKPFGITVRELSGDQSLSRVQIQETQVIVTTPEKWDIITRKAGDRTFTQLVRLMVIDEVHLLHDSRGPVLEALVARTVRQVEQTQEMVRLVGLSATLPNFEDVAVFLRVDPAKGLFFFDNSFRPVPLQQQYIGITEKKAIKRFQLMNEICYEKVMACMPRHNQVLIFVHSRAETGKTARAIRDMVLENDVLGLLVKEDSATAEVLRTEAETAKSDELRDLLPYGIAIHHAGMMRGDRNVVEDLYAAKHVQVLVSTATLAWGVNLPAHTVIIKGTQMYSPEAGAWVELSPMDVLQMMGRAGRPQFDLEGEGIILTHHKELQYYLSLNNQQLPMESQLAKTLADHLNAEVVSGSVQSIDDAVNWLGYTYLYVRMLRNPSLYKLDPSDLASDPTLRGVRAALAREAASQLDKSGLAKFDRRSGALQHTVLGRVASYYYISHESMAVYNDHLKPTMGRIELFRVFALSGEFRHIIVREGERTEVAKLTQRVPEPIKESPDEPAAKVNALLQAYISGLKLDGFALVSDMTYVQQSAARIMRALFEIAHKRGWAALADKALTLCKLVERRCWESSTPLRQFKVLPEPLLKKLERKEVPWERYYDLKAADLGELVKNPKMGRVLHKLVHQFPRLELSATVQPITRALLRVELSIQPDFAWDQKVHDFALLFHVLVEDVDNEKLLHSEPFLLKMQYAKDEALLSFTVPLTDPLPPQYFVRVVSDRWLHAQAEVPVSFRHLLLPAKFPPPTELLDLRPLPVSELGNGAYVQLFTDMGIQRFNPIQTQTFAELYESDDNVLVCAPTGSGKTVCAEFALLRMFKTDPGGRAVYVAPKAEIADERFKDWQARLGPDGLGKRIARLTGEAAVDAKLVGEAAVTVATAEQWDALSRRWKQRKAVQEVALFIADELHLLGGADGPTMEVVVSRMRYISNQTERRCRIVGLGSSMADAKDVGDWIGATSHSLFNFHPNVRPVPLETHLHGFDIAHFGSRMLAMARPAYNAVSAHCGGTGKPGVVFVPSRRQCQLTAIDLVTYAAADGRPDDFLKDDVEPGAAAATAELVREPALKQTLARGVGFLHAGMLEEDRERVLSLYRRGIVQVLVVPQTMAWSLGVTAHLVVIMGTETYEGQTHRYVDYPVTDMLQMIGLASRPRLDNSGKCVILCASPKKESLKKLLYDPLPIESHLDHVLADHLNAEVVTRTVENKQDAVDYVTWTLYYRRLTQNPNYYNMAGVSHRHLSDHLSELVEQCVSDLSEARCLAVEEDMKLSALNLGMIAAYYYIQYTTVELFANSVGPKTKLRGLLDIISSASEYNVLPVRQHEERTLEALLRRLPHKVNDDWKLSDTPAKAHVLLQAHFSRAAVGIDLRGDQRIVVGEALRLLQAVVDVISSNGWLRPALDAMELSQMVVQAVWNKDSYLRQVPHMTPELIAACEAAGVEGPMDIVALEDSKRDALLPLPASQMADVARFCNAFPNVDVTYAVQDADDIAAGDSVTVMVTLEREVDEDDEEPEGGYGQVVAPHYPKPKTEGWWLVVGDRAKNSLLAVKRVTLQRRAKVKLDFAAPEEVGNHELTLLFMCDSYQGCDQEYELVLKVGEEKAEEDDEEEEEG